MPEWTIKKNIAIVVGENIEARMADLLVMTVTKIQRVNIENMLLCQIPPWKNTGK